MRFILAILLLVMSVMANATVAPTYPNVAYGADPLQTFDVYAPRAAKNLPIIFMVHGGAWVGGDKTNDHVITNKVPYFLPQRIIFISVNYRLLTHANGLTVLDEANDVAKALAYVQAHASTWGGDGTRVVIMGHSAGAHLTTLIVSAPAIQSANGVQPWLGSIALDSAGYDIVYIMNHPHLALYDYAFGTDSTFWQQTSPVYRLGASTPPILLVCSTLRADTDCGDTQTYGARDTGFGANVFMQQIALHHEEINADVGLRNALTWRISNFLCSLHVGVNC